MRLYQPVMFVGLGGTGCDVGAELELGHDAFALEATQRRQERSYIGQEKVVGLREQSEALRTRVQ